MQSGDQDVEMPPAPPQQAEHASPGDGGDRARLAAGDALAPSTLEGVRRSARTRSPVHTRSRAPPDAPTPPSLPGTPTRAQPPAEPAPTAADPTTGRGTRRGRDEDVPPTVERDTSGLDGLPAPRDSKDASGKPYDNAASWMDDRVKKMQALWKKLPEQEQVTPSPYLPP